MLPTILAAATLAIYLFMVSPAINPKRWPLAIDLSRQGIGFGLIGLLILILLFHQRPEIIPLIVLMIAVHEYGHVLAFRLAGHRQPVFRLAPFGGVAFSERPAHTQPESAFISLMGPGFSVVLVLAAMLGILLLRPDAASIANGSQPVEAWRVSVVGILGQIVLWTAFLNFLNLMPFYPLDGGRAVRSIASGMGPDFADRLLYGLTGALVLFGIFKQSIFLILIGVFGLVAIRNEEPLNRRMPAISSPHALLVGGAYFSLLVFLGYFSLPLLYAYFPSLLWLRATLSGG